MGKTSTKVKERWNKKTYDEIKVRVPKGIKESLKKKCDENGISMNYIFVEAAKQYLES